MQLEPGAAVRAELLSRALLRRFQAWNMSNGALRREASRAALRDRPRRPENRLGSPQERHCDRGRPNRPQMSIRRRLEVCDQPSLRG